MTQYVIPDGTNYADAIRNLVRLRLPDVGFEMKPTAYTTPHLVYGTRCDPNPWVDAEDLALSIGMRLKLRGDRVMVYIPLDQRLRNWYYDVTKPLRNLKRRVSDRINPPVEWPDPDYSD